MGKRLGAEFLGTFWLVFGGCGSAILAAKFFDPQNQNVNYGIGLVGVALAFGLTVLTMAYAIGHIFWVPPEPRRLRRALDRWPFQGDRAHPLRDRPGARRHGWRGRPVRDRVGQGRVLAQRWLRSQRLWRTLARGYSLVAGFVAEAVLTFMFLMIILGVTDPRAPQGFAPLAIGLGLTLIHLIGIPVTNLSVNPARSTGPALLVGGWALAQLWLFWVAPVLGAAVTV